MSDPVSASVAVEHDSSAVAASEPARRPASRIRIAVLYCILVFGITWPVCIYVLMAKDIVWRSDGQFFHFAVSRNWAIAQLSGFSPGIAAVILGLSTRWRYFSNPFSQLRSPVRPKLLYAFSLSMPILLFSVSLFVGEYFAGYHPLNVQPSSLANFLATFLLILPLAPLWEEPGWRGCLLPLLSPRFGYWRAALIIGVIWATWHLPAYILLLQTSWNHFFVFCLIVVGMSVVLAALYRAGGNSLRLPILFHASWNTMSRSVTDDGSNFDAKAWLALAGGVWLLAAFCWLWWSGKQSEASNPANI